MPNSRADEKSKLEPLYHFCLPGLHVRLALGHRYNAWYLIFARHYRTADCREVCRIDSGTMGTVIYLENEQNHFFFDPEAFTGWEKEDTTLLDMLLSLKPSVLKVINTKNSSVGKFKQVQVMLPEGQLAHWCEGCGEWETMEGSEDIRWKSTRRDTLPGYLCPEVRFTFPSGERFSEYIYSVMPRIGVLLSCYATLWAWSRNSSDIPRLSFTCESPSSESPWATFRGSVIVSADTAG
jgi:hypothetical protein